MAVRLTNRPPAPEMGAPGDLLHAHCVVDEDYSFHGTTVVRSRIQAEVTAIKSLLMQFSTICVTGHLEIVILPHTYDLSGELTAYHVPTDALREDLMRRIDHRAFSLCHDFAPAITRIEFKMHQTLIRVEEA